MTKQQAKDYDLIQNLWHMLRDYGDITNTEQDEDRWSALISDANTAAGNDPEARMLMADVLAVMEHRACGKRLPGGFPEMDQKLLYRFHKLNTEKQASVIQMLDMMV